MRAAGFPGGMAERQIAAARQALSAGRPAEALQALHLLMPGAAGLPPALRATAFALHGTAALQLGDAAAAAGSFRAAMQADRRDPRLACNLGAALHRAGRQEEALAAFREAERRDRRFPPAAYGRGLALAALGRYAESAEAFRRACSLDPANVEARENLAMALAASGDGAAAERAWTESLQAFPAGSPQHRRLAAGLARHLAAGGRVADALPWFIAAGAAEAGADPRLRRDHAAALLQAGRPTESAAILEALAEREADPDLLSNLGAARLAADDPEGAMAALRRALVLAPGHRGANLHAGHALQALGALEEAAAHHRRALAQDAAYLPALIGLANVLHEIGDLAGADRAFAAAEQAAAGRPEQPQLRWNRALHDLLAGRYAPGWDGYAWRWRIPDFPTPWRETGLPYWQGGEVQGRHLFVWGEQGPGDEVMFASCLPDLLRAGARVTLATDPRLMALFARSFPDIAVQPQSAPVPQADGALPLGDLPRHFRRAESDFAGRSPWLRADPEAVAAWRARWQAEGAGTRAVIGLSWKGGVHAAERRRRGSALADWAPLLRLPGLAWVNMQYGADAAETFARAAAELGFATLPGPDPGGDLDTLAAAIAATDAVVSMANTLVHLAGGLGRPALVAVPSAPSWRWQLGREDSPWYPGIRLVRQRHGEPWPAVLERAAGLLPQLLATAPAGGRDGSEGGGDRR